MTTTTHTARHRAWPGPGVLTCTDCGQPVHADANGALGWMHDDPALDTPAGTTPDGLPLVEEREGMTPIVRCADCGGTSWRNVGETSFVYQRTAIDTADDDPQGDDYDSGDIDATWTRSVDFAECADCGTSPDDAQSAALGRAWGTDRNPRERFAVALSAASAVRLAFSDRGDGSLLSLTSAQLDALEALGDAIEGVYEGYPPEARAHRAANPRPLGDELPA